MEDLTTEKLELLYEAVCELDEKHYDEKGEKWQRNVNSLKADLKEKLEARTADLPRDILVTSEANFIIDEPMQERIAETIVDFLSEEFGYCVNGYDWFIGVSNIDWDTSQECFYE